MITHYSSFHFLFHYTPYNPNIALILRAWAEQGSPRSGLSTLIGYILVFYWDNGKENGDYRDYRCCTGIIGYMLVFYWDNGKENGNYYNGESNGKENGN